jgi:hypothetical protein
MFHRSHECEDIYEFDYISRCQKKKNKQKNKKRKNNKNVCDVVCAQLSGARTFFPFGADNTECGTAGIFGMFLLPRRDTHTHTHTRERDVAERALKENRRDEANPDNGYRSNSSPAMALA